MKKIIVFLQFLLIFSFCSDNSTESEIIDTPNTTTNFIEATTTTLIDEKTTTSTVRMITDTVVSDIKIEILNCPSEKVNIEIGELFELQFSVQAGFADIVSIFYLFELNDEYYSRLPLDKENHSTLFNFPNSHEKTFGSTFVEKLADGDEYWISIEVIDDESFFSYDLCVVKF